MKKAFREEGAWVCGGLRSTHGPSPERPSSPAPREKVRGGVRAGGVLWGAGVGRSALVGLVCRVWPGFLMSTWPPRAWQLKQMQELEQEKEVLLQGLEMMARGRDWYQQQLQRVRERRRRLGQSRARAVSAAPGLPVPVLRPIVSTGGARVLGPLQHTRTAHALGQASPSGDTRGLPVCSEQSLRLGPGAAPVRVPLGHGG